MLLVCLVTVKSEALKSAFSQSTALQEKNTPFPIHDKDLHGCVSCGMMGKVSFVGCT